MFTKISPQQFSDSLFSMQGISKETMTEHLKLYQGYVNKYNEINEKLSGLTDEDYAKANQVYSQLRELKLELSFAWGGIINHEIYFSHLGGKGGTASGGLKTEIERSFGSFAAYLQDLKATGVTARGWVWTAWNEKEKRLINYLGDSQNTFLVWSARPILALDTYEHAYFKDFGVNRLAYIDAFLNNLDWPTVENNFSLAKK